MRIKLNDIISEYHIKRTQILLRTIRLKYGAEMEILVKKILMVSLYMEYYQERTNKHVWVGYLNILLRNEGIARRYKMTEPKKSIIKDNSITSTFMDIPSNLITDPSVPMSILEDELEKYCERTFITDVTEELNVNGAYL